MIKSAEEIQRMSVAGALTAKVLEALDEVVRPGISTAEIDRFCEIPAAKGAGRWLPLRKYLRCPAHGVRTARKRSARSARRYSLDGLFPRT